MSSSFRLEQTYIPLSYDIHFTPDIRAKTFSAVETIDLCNNFTRVIGYDMKPFFKAGIEQTNYPIVILEDDGTLHQKRFAHRGLFEDRIWPIVLNVMFSRNGDIQAKTIELGGDSINLGIDCDWCKVNHNCTCFCRVWQKGKYFNRVLEAFVIASCIQLIARHCSLIIRHSRMPESFLILILFSAFRILRTKSICLSALSFVQFTKEFWECSPQVANISLDTHRF
jgi:hypothetical protein